MQDRFNTSFFKMEPENELYNVTSTLLDIHNGVMYFIYRTVNHVSYEVCSKIKFKHYFKVFEISYLSIIYIVSFY